MWHNVTLHLRQSKMQLKLVNDINLPTFIFTVSDFGLRFGTNGCILAKNTMPENLEVPNNLSFLFFLQMLFRVHEPKY